MANPMYKIPNKFEDMDIDELLEKLTPEELEQLNNDIDPDLHDSLLPPGQRCKDQTKKAPSGPYDRKHLLDFIEKASKEDPDWERNQPFKHEMKGKVWKPKSEASKPQANDAGGDIETEFDEILAQATEEELVDLAAQLGFYSMMNQTQFHASFGNDGVIPGGFKGIAKHAALKLVKDEDPDINSTNVEHSLNQIQANDPDLTQLNLNNIKNMSIDRLVLFAEALKTNTHLEQLLLANTRANDHVAKALSESLPQNNTLKVLNVESNFITPSHQLELIQAVCDSTSIVELRLSNQQPMVLGVQVEMAIAKLVEENPRLLALGMHFNTPSARARVTESIKRNIDNNRKTRVGRPAGDQA